MVLSLSLSLSLSLIIGCFQEDHKEPCVSSASRGTDVCVTGTTPCFNEGGRKKTGQGKKRKRVPADEVRRVGGKAVCWFRLLASGDNAA